AAIPSDSKAYKAESSFSSKRTQKQKSSTPSKSNETASSKASSPARHTKVRATNTSDRGPIPSLSHHKRGVSSSILEQSVQSPRPFLRKRERGQGVIAINLSSP